MLSESLIFQILALACLGPGCFLALRAVPAIPAYRLAILLAAAGPVLWCLHVLQTGWRIDFSFTLWVSTTVTLLFFAGLSIASATLRQMAVLALPYLAVLLAVSVLSNGVHDRVLGVVPGGWISSHILLAVITYALITLAAISGLAVFLKERALKSRQTGLFSKSLPPVADAERAQDRLLQAGEVVLGLGLVTGIAIHVQQSRPLLELDHKTLLTLLAFVVIGGLLLLQRRSGLRGRRAAQIVMIAYLLVTLAYPGVKFVTDFLQGG